MIDIEAVEAATDKLLAQDVRVLNAYLLADDEAGHARRLLELMDPPQDAVVLDAGCGVGELARLMYVQRPDLSFMLVNISAGQLQHAPTGVGFTPIVASFDQVPLPDASVDVVLFAFSLVHSDDWGRTLREAHRLLKPGGSVFIFDFARLRGDNDALRKKLSGSAYRPAEILDLAKRCGLELRSPNDAMGHRPAVERLRQLHDDALLDDLAPMTLKLHKMPAAPPIDSAFARHERIAFQFSGGRDSTAALYLLRPYWDRMDVYFLDTGEIWPETAAVLEQVEHDLGKPIIRIHGDVAKVREEHGLASDIVPVDNTPVGRLVSGRTVKIISRYECCARSLMLPMHARMLADGITLIVRGQRDEDYASQPRRSGDVDGPLEVLYPVQSWTTAEVDGYIAQHQLPKAGFYEGGMPHGSDCMGCTAWWGEGRGAYLRKNHPQAFETYSARMRTIRIEIDRQMNTLDEQA